MQLKSGTLLHGGTYRIEKVLGQGSFGITYLGYHTGLEKKIAIKEFFMEELNSRDADSSVTGMTDGSLSYNYGQKFRKEALNLSRLDHPNIVRVTDSFDENGTYYYVMDFIEGENLNEYLKHTTLSPEEAVRIITAVAEALRYMHVEKQMLHLDLKPGNIMRRASDGHIFLIDFGLAKHFSSTGQPETSTPIGLGTSGYAPIEQSNQQNGTEFRPGIDVYALGATFYKLLTCKTPPPASELVSEPGMLRDVMESKAIDPRLIDIVENAMQPSVRKRTPSVRNFILALEAASAATTDDEDEKTIILGASKTESAPAQTSSDNPTAQPASDNSAAHTSSNSAAARQVLQPSSASAAAKPAPQPGELRPESGTVSSSAGTSSVPPFTKKSSRKTLVFVLAGLCVILVVVAVVFFITKGNTHKTESATAQVSTDTAQVDSGDDYTNQDDPTADDGTAADLTQDDADSQDDEIIDFLKDFYSSYVFGNREFDPSLVSSKVRQKLQADYEYDDGGYAVWDFRTNNQDGPSSVSKVTSITPDADGWYRVDMIDMGIKATKFVQVSYNNGNMQITDFSTN